MTTIGRMATVHPTTEMTQGEETEWEEELDKDDDQGEDEDSGDDAGALQQGRDPGLRLVNPGRNPHTVPNRR